MLHVSRSLPTAFLNRFPCHKAISPAGHTETSVQSLGGAKAKAPEKNILCCEAPERFDSWRWDLYSGGLPSSFSPLCSPICPDCSLPNRILLSKGIFIRSFAKLLTPSGELWSGDVSVIVHLALEYYVGQWIQVEYICYIFNHPVARLDFGPRAQDWSCVVYYVCVNGDGPA